MDNKNTPTDYKRGFKRLLVLLSIAWFGGWALELADEYFSDQHRKLLMYTGNGRMTFTHLTLAGGFDAMRSKAPTHRVLDGEQFIFFFSTDDLNFEKTAADWVNNLSRQDIETAKEIAYYSRLNAVVEKGAIALGVPLALLATWLIGLYVYRGFRPKAEAAA